MHQSINRARNLYKVIRWNGSKRKVRTYLTYLLGLFFFFFPPAGRVALHPFPAH
jgi:hypothetical protein